MSDNDLIFSFDIGTGSIGECVRQGSEIKHLESLLIPSEYASTKDATKKRHQIRTREAHKAREDWWRKQAKEAGIEVLESRQPTKENPNIKPDERLLREFPKDGDNTIYTSCLLRIALLQGKKLDGWQIYKAVWSAIQHRGYDEKNHWKNDDDSAENKKNVNEYIKYCKDNKFEEKYWLPCYVDAHRMGIWSPEDSNNLYRKRNNETNPAPARNKNHSKYHLVFPRSKVEEELKHLLSQAAKLFPKLAGKENYIVYGPGEVQYASMKKMEFSKYRGKEWDWQGLLGQKIPRFDNRMLNKCCCMSHFNVCRADDMLNQEVMFLMMLKNMRYHSKNKPDEMLTAEQIKELFNKFKDRLKFEKNEKDKVKNRKKEVIPKSLLRKWVIEKLNGEIHPAHSLIPMPNAGGRSRYCRPALEVIREVILSGKTPKQVYEECVAKNKIENPEQNSKKGRIQSDFDFLIKKGTSEKWENFYISDNRYELREMSADERKIEIEKTLNEINNPIVSHRLKWFKKELNKLAFGEPEKKNPGYGIPEKVVLEFARDEFMGKQAKEDYYKFIKEQTKERKIVVEELEKAGFSKPSGEMIRKMMLFRQQDGIDFYSMQNIKLSHLGEYEIDHVIPRSRGGSDAFYNIILTTNKNNSAKGDKTPYEWLGKGDIWDNISEKLKVNKKMGSKKKLLFMASSEEQYKLLIDKYTQLSQTAYISKLAQKVTALTFGWGMQTKDDNRNIVIATGGQTARIRSRFKLDRLLHSGMTDEEFEKALRNGEIEKKNRSNPRHHALDALVLSAVPEIRVDKNRKGKYDDIYPSWLTRDFCEKEVAHVYPKQIKFSKAQLAEVLYGKREVKKEDGLWYTYAITRQNEGTRIEDYYVKKSEKKSDIEDMEKLRNKILKKVNHIFSNDIRTDFKKKLEEKPTEEQWNDFIKNYKVNGTCPHRISVIGNPGVKGFKEKQPLPPNYKEIRPNSKQYYETKTGQKWSYTAQLICLNEKDEWEVHPVYAWDSLYERIKKAEQEFKKVVKFHSRQSVEIKNDCANGKIKKGIYILATIQNGNWGVLESQGEKIDASLNELMNIGEMWPII